ncbi:phosphoenolpyruvate--protein phosphotransferase [Treponema endosymbiont of Eucomonympha sp.]|uniref:phosphoenolpyruvate--protein phosphotransferase n=1 Tax=Treponema endosymbiont of Eucomonympha sp. TaxID=1580831 RepID=UPI0007808CD0|nr:phosphoenolpyruvate--protein phosphotransferase [Treponema endosymbiont of Eucomonympha sp.]
MKTLRGQRASDGIAAGKLKYLLRKPRSADCRSVRAAGAEIARADDALHKAGVQLEALYQKALRKFGAAEAAVFRMHQMMLADPDYVGAVHGIIAGEKLSAECAVAKAADFYAAAFAGMSDEYLRARAADVRDVSERVLDALQGNDPLEIASGAPVIVAADDLAPSETVQLDTSCVLAFVTARGSGTSHTAIFARNQGIPAVVALGDALSPDCDGSEAIVDGASGTLYLDPDEATQERMQTARSKRTEEAALLAELRGKPNRTLDGTEIAVFANIGSPPDAESALANDAGGIGLFRSEFLYLGRNACPSEDEQFEAYKTVAEKMGGRQVVIRTLDIGADKQAGYFKLPAEANPALGLRALRLCLSRPELFLTQLRAIYRASAFGNVAIMFPMVASAWEVRKAREWAAKARAQLAEAGRDFAPGVKIGIMVETPAAAVSSDLLAREADFFSIGTNDLTQYALAVDRQNSSLAEFGDPRHPAVLRLIRMTAENARRAGIPIGICGELGADMSLTGAFLQLGIDELSVPPPAILPLRRKIRETDVRTLPPAEW